MQNLFEIHVQGSFRGHLIYPAWTWLETIQAESGELVESTTRTHSQTRSWGPWSCCSVYTPTIWPRTTPSAVYNPRLVYTSWDTFSEKAGRSLDTTGTTLCSFYSLSIFSYWPGGPEEPVFTLHLYSLKSRTTPSAVYNLRFGLSTYYYNLVPRTTPGNNQLSLQSEVPATDPTTIWGLSPLSGVCLTLHSSADKSTSKTV